ncbi:hypothetical protein BKA65DRAFT_560592 [Rhexocercosporidium sp. MPI-PUGE-AT-0058]|nr:hypothetical protein BKA65DRAFT_560592 [Rhexocercosporidium sp. MPI-PUGE-AT-0058]
MTGVFASSSTYHPELEDSKPSKTSKSNLGCDRKFIEQNSAGASRRRKRRLEKANFFKPHTDIVHISLGSATFSIYADFLSWHCPLLVEECRHAPDKGETPRSLKDIKVNVFGLFVNWLYNDKLVNKRGQPPYQHRAMGVWARRRQEGVIQMKAFGYVYSNSKEGDGLRRYIVDICVLMMLSFSDDIKSENFPPELLQQHIFAASLIDQVKTEEGEIDVTKYHLKVEQ